MESLNRPPLKLVFGTPEFLPAGVVQSTVRVGQKWRDDLKGRVAPRIPCVDLEGNVLGTATIVGSLYGSFKDFGYIGSIVNHDEKCRDDYDGIVDTLKECYPDFNPETNVITVIFFKYAPVKAAADESAEEESEEASETTEDDKSDDTSDKTSETVADDTDDSGAVASDDKAAVADAGADGGESG